MTRRVTPNFSFQALAAYWHAIALMLILVGRQVSAGNKTGHYQAYRQAEQMELWSRAALACLTQQLTCLQDGPSPEDPKEAHARDHLYLIATCLIALAMLAAKMKAEVKAFAGGATLPACLSAQLRDGIGEAQTYAPTFLDSS